MWAMQPVSTARTNGSLRGARPAASSAVSRRETRMWSSLVGSSGMTGGVGVARGARLGVAVGAGLGVVVGNRRSSSTGAAGRGRGRFGGGRSGREGRRNRPRARCRDRHGDGRRARVRPGPDALPGRRARGHGVHGRCPSSSWIQTGRRRRARRTPARRLDPAAPRATDARSRHAGALSPMYSGPAPRRPVQGAKPRPGRPAGVGRRQGLSACPAGASEPSCAWF